MRKSIIAAASLFLLDRLVKNIVWFSPQLKVGGFLHPLLNTNIAFSFQIPGFSSERLTMLLAVIVLGFCIAIIHYYRKKDPSFFWWSLIGIGALSNLLDRVLLGGVLDYIDLGWFPVFNLSDTYITLGIAALFFFELRRKQFITLRASIR